MTGGATTYKMLVWHVRDPFPPQTKRRQDSLDHSNFIIESEIDRHSTNNLGR